RDRHSNQIDLNNYGANTNGDGLLTISLQPGSFFDNSNYRADLFGALNLWFTQHELLVGAAQNIRDGFSSVAIPATCPGATPTSPRVLCAQNIFHPVTIPETPYSAPVGTHTRINDIGYYLFDRIRMSEWLQLLGGVRKVDYTETNLDTHTVTFHDGPTVASYGFVLKPWAPVSIYGTYIEGLESTPVA